MWLVLDETVSDSGILGSMLQGMGGMAIFSAMLVHDALHYL